MPLSHDPGLLVGFNTSDDACVYKLRDDLALIQTVDFFTPIVDNPYQFGQIAAANSLSDIYAMGATPNIALNILCIPSCMPPQDVAAIIAGGADKVREAGAVIAGGHSVIDPEPKYGLCVSACVDPSAIWSNAGATRRDTLILTKPLGNGILATAAKKDHISQEEFAEAIKSMATLNKYARDIAVKSGVKVNACTDITGFGFVGHACEMAEASGCTFVFDAMSIPLLKGAYELAEKGIVPGGAKRNEEYLTSKVHFGRSFPQALKSILYDPQTSGGLLFAVQAGDDAGTLLSNLEAGGVEAAVVGLTHEMGTWPIEFH